MNIPIDVIAYIFGMLSIAHMRIMRCVSSVIYSATSQIFDHIVAKFQYTRQYNRRVNMFLDEIIDANVCVPDWIIKKHCPRIEYALMLEGNIEKIKYAIECGYLSDNKKLIINAALFARKELFDYILSLSDDSNKLLIMNSHNIFKCAVRSGNIEFAKYVYNLIINHQTFQYIVFDNGLIAAIEISRIDILQWLLDIDSSDHTPIFTYAAIRQNNFDMLKLLCNYGCTICPRCVSQSVKNDNIDILLWMVNYNTDMFRNEGMIAAYKVACDIGNLKLLQWLLGEVDIYICSRGKTYSGFEYCNAALINESIYLNAFRGGNKELIMWIYNCYKIEFGNNAWSGALMSKNIEFVTWLHHILPNHTLGNNIIIYCTINFSTIEISEWVLDNIKLVLPKDIVHSLAFHMKYDVIYMLYDRGLINNEQLMLASVGELMIRYRNVSALRWLIDHGITNIHAPINDDHPEDMREWLIEYGFGHLIPAESTMNTQ